MMKSSGGALFSCLLVLAASSCVESAFQRLDNIDDLKRVYSDPSLCLHSLTLLHWFANAVEFDNNNNVHLYFNPDADYGSHYFSNFENMLATVPRGQTYYTVGNINRPFENVCSSTMELPEYVLYPRVIEHASMGRNRDRIIISLQGRRIVQIYLTQHFRRQDQQGSMYDPAHTYEIGTPLLQQLRQFAFNGNTLSLQELRNQFNQNIDNSQLNNIINIWGSRQAPLGLLFLLVIRARTNLVGVCTTSRRWIRDVEVTKPKSEWENCELQQIHLDVKTGPSGEAVIHWRNVSQQQIDEGVAAVLYKNQMDKTSSIYNTIGSTEGSFTTSEYLKEGLQFRLHKTQPFWGTIKDEICRGKEFESPHSVPITGYAKLQLFAQNGEACFRLYIKEHCKEWKSNFYYFYVGLFESAEKSTNDGLSGQWQWAIKFEQRQEYGEFHTFEYCTSTTLATGLQARFMDAHGTEKARTPMWP